MNRAAATRAGILAGALLIVLAPLFVVPLIQGRQDEPDRPGRDAVCPIETPGSGGGVALPVTPAEQAQREDVIIQVVPDDGGFPVFEPRQGGGSGGGTGTGTGPGAGEGDGPPTPATGEDPSPDEPTTEVDDVVTPPPPTLPPEEAAREEIERDEDEADSASPLLLLIPLLLAALIALALYLASRRPPVDGAGPGDGEDGAVHPVAPLVPPPGDDVERRLRAAFRAGLLALDRTGLVPYDPALPSGRIARRLAHAPGADGFGAATAGFDAVVYGRRPATEADIALVSDGFARVLAGVGAASEISPIRGTNER